MPTSKYPTYQYPSTNFVESSGAILFDLKSHRACLLRYKSEVVLPKGRRDIGEHRAETAIREVREETGYPCHLLPVRLDSRQPGAAQNEQAAKEGRSHVPDRVNVHEGIAAEPFYMQVRQPSKDVAKVIYWFIAALDHGVEAEDKKYHCEPQFLQAWFEYANAADALTFDADKEVVRRAIGIVQSSYV